MKQVMNFTLDTSVAEGLRTLAQREDRPMSRIVNRTLAQLIAEQAQDDKALESA